MSEAKNTGPAKSIWQVLIAAIGGLLGFLVALIFQRRKGDDTANKPEVFHLGTTVTLPASNQRGRPLTVVEREVPAEIPRSSDRELPDEFVPLRMFVNFEVIDSRTGEAVVDFSDVPLVAQFTYSEEQVKAAQRLASSESDYAKALAANGNMPILGFWDGKHWIKFTKEKHQLGYSSTTTGGVATVKLTRWADPPLGWFPP